MTESFTIPVHYKGADLGFDATLQVFGYSHRFVVSIQGTDVLFERDEEGHYRAVIPLETPGPVPPIPLLQSVAASIEHILA